MFYDDIIEEVQWVLNTTKDVYTIDLIVTAFEELKEGSNLTKNFGLPLPKYDNQTVITQLDITKCVDILKSLHERCMDTEEYEMCSRIKKLLDKHKV